MRKIYLLSICLVAALVASAQFVNAPRNKTTNYPEFKIGKFNFPPSLAAPGCDTLLWGSNTISSYGSAVYVADVAQPYDSGFLSGVNAYGDRQKGNYFDVRNSANNNYVTGVRYAFAWAKSTDMSKTIYFRVYEIGATDITLAGSSPAIPLSSLTVGALVDYKFPTPIPLTSKLFIISVDFSNLSFAANDSFAVYTNRLSTNLNAPDSAVEQESNGDWGFISSSWFGGQVGMFTYLFPYVSSNNTCTLPVSLSSISAQQTGLSNKVTWTTKTEFGNKGFEVERSTDGNVFTKLEFVPTAAPLGSSNKPIDYEFIDHSPGTGVNYYRIKQIDQNGKVSFSNVALLNRSLEKLKGILTYYPNPVKTGLNLQLAATQAGNNIISVVNMSGVVVLQQSLYTTGSLQTVSLNVANLPKGTYIVRLNGENKTAKFVKE